MKKELPKIFQNKINKEIQNNESVYYGDRKKVIHTNVDEIFQINQIYKTDVKITTKEKKTVEKKVIGRTQNNLITFDNEIIPIADIEFLEVL